MGQQGPQHADMDLDPDSLTWTSPPEKAPELPTLRSQQNTIGKPTNRPQNSDTVSPIGRPVLESHKVHQDNTTTDDATPESEYTYLMNTPDNTQGGEHGDDTESTENTAPTEDDPPQPQQLNKAEYKL